jgi:hypothetical protein
MKTNPIFLSAVLLIGLACHAFAQGFDSGSNGSLGALDVTSNTTINLPADGKLHYTTVNVRPNTRLTFNRNSNNTPVYILAQGDVVIDGVIDVNGAAWHFSTPVGGKGGPGGFDGGMPGFGAEVPPGDGFGPGGGKGGQNLRDPGNANNAGPGSYSTSGGVNGGPTYGSPLLIPLIGGSGAGGTAGQPGAGGAGGGGAILIASNTRITLSGRVESLGGNNHAFTCCFEGTGGSGGAVRLLAPRVEGNGTVDVNGQLNGGLGRIRVDTVDRTNLRLTFAPNAATTVGANMFVFPSPLPKLDVIEAAGTTIPLGGNPVRITLPFGSSTNRTVVVQARDFSAVVPIAVVLTPDSGPRVTVQAQVDNTTQNPATVTVPVSLRPNVQTTIHVWTR